MPYLCQETLLKGRPGFNSNGQRIRGNLNIGKSRASEKTDLIRSLARDEPVTPRVACLTAWTLTKKVPRFVKPDFRLCIPRF